MNEAELVLQRIARCAHVGEMDTVQNMPKYKMLNLAREYCVKHGIGFSGKEKSGDEET